MSALYVLLEKLEKDGSLYQPEQLRQRIEVLDQLETYLIYELSQDDAMSPGASLHQRAEAMCADLESANRQQYRSIRHKIQQGFGADALFEWVAMVGDDAHSLDQINGIGYDHLDVLVSGILQFEEPGDAIAELIPDMVFYQPTPARDIFDLLKRAKLNERDVLIDLGSGFGHVPLLVAICTGARCIGIEQEAAYVTSATRAAAALNVHNAKFVHQDVRVADFSSGTVFYLYTPFTGTMLRSVLDLLKDEASRREIRICTLGPCTLVVAQEPWLQAIDERDIDRVAIFRSVSI